MFADDVKLYSKVDTVADAAFLQQQLDDLNRWSVRWQLTLIPSKCRVLTLTLRRNPTISIYSVGGQQLERVSVMRDLGVLLDEKLTFGNMWMQLFVRRIGR